MPNIRRVLGSRKPSFKFTAKSKPTRNKKPGQPQLFNSQPCLGINGLSTGFTKPAMYKQT